MTGRRYFEDAPTMPNRKLLLHADALRSALAVSITSLAWTTIISALEMIVGLRAHSLTLVAFAFTGALDAAGSAVLADHFDRDVRASRQARRSEHVALRVISIGMFGVGIATGVVSVWRLTRGSETTATIAGPAIPAAAGGGLALL